MLHVGHVGRSSEESDVDPEGGSHGIGERGGSDPGPALHLIEQAVGVGDPLRQCALAQLS